MVIKKMRQLTYKGLARLLGRQAMIAVGAAVTALGYSLFQVPFDITAGGLSGAAHQAFGGTAFPGVAPRSE